VELLVKVLDGCGLTGSYWVFAGGLTNVGVTLGVTDMVTGEMRTYRSAAGTAFQPILDTAGLAVCGKRGAAAGWPLGPWPMALPAEATADGSLTVLRQPPAVAARD
jgi:hypothetical protein